MWPAEGHGAQAAVFAALGDPTRLAIVSRLAGGEALSIAALAGGGRLSRQAVTKHIAVLEAAGVVASEKIGRERRLVLRPDAVTDANAYLREVSALWDTAIGRLRLHLEESQAERD